MEDKMRIPKQASLILPFLLICLFQSNINAQGFLKNFLSNSLIKEGKQFKSNGKFPSAITKFTKSIKRKPDNLEAYYQLGLIFEEVMHDYDKAISLYKSVISLSDGVNPVGTDEELKAFNSLITKASTGIDRVIGQKFESIEKPKIPVYIMVKPYQKISKEPKLLSFSIHKTTSYASEFELLEYSNNWYQINVPSTGKGWVNGKDILKIIQKDEKAIETSPAGKAALYHRFVDQYPESHFAQNAKGKADDIYYGLAKEEGSINSYSMYLKENPNGKYSEEVQLKKDELTFEDEGFLNNINRLRQWIINNPESTYLEKAKNRIDKLTFAQAKYDNNTVSMEGYIIDYPAGKFVPEAKQLLEDLKYNQAKFNDTVASYGKYLDEYPEGKYADAAARRVDGKNFSALLNSQNIELLVGHLGKETNKERKELVKKRVEELHFKKADGVNNDVEAIKMYEDYLQKYQDGLYVKDANARIEALSFNIALSKDNLESLKKFLKTYPNGKFAQNAKNRIEEIVFNGTKHVDTIDGYRNFIREYPDGVFSPQARNRIEGLAFEDAKTKNTTNAYKGFIAEYPDSHLTKTAKNIIEAEYFENARLKGTVEAYNEYIELYPDGSHLVESQLMIDGLTFEPYRVKGSVGGFEKFIKKYPDNRYVKDAMARVDRLNFEYYKKKNTLKAYKKFVNKYPDNRYVSEAKQKISRLTPMGEHKSDKSSFWFWMIILHFSSIAIIAVVILKREKILKNISDFKKKREEQEKKQIIVTKSFNKNEHKDKPVQDKAKSINYESQIGKKHEEHEKEQITVKKSFNQNELKDRPVQDKAKNINYESQPIGKTRNAGVVIILAIITAGIYYAVWYYKINTEIKAHDPDQKFSPGWATVAIFCPIVNIVSMYNTADRIKKMQKADGLQDLISPGAALVWILLFFMGYFIVVQGALNNHWYDHGKKEGTNC